MGLLLRSRASLRVAAVALVALVVSASTAAAVGLRSPQVPFNSGALQAYFVGVGEVFNVTTAQADVQVWSVNIPGTSDFTLTLKNGASDEIGVYNSWDPVPALFRVFPSAATAGWYAVLHFASGNLKVSLFDGGDNFQGQVTHLGVDPNSFGFYIKNTNGTFFSQDGRSGGPQVLTYAGVVAAGDWWLCFEDAPYNALTSLFDSAVLSIQSVRPTPARARSWGSVKTLYH